MTSYIPGQGLKKPLNMLETPIFPDIRKGPPRFLWTKNYWKVDEGQTMKQIEHIPQMTEGSILYQSYDYNSQHAYGRFPKRNVFVNKEFRPPLQDRDDFLPLSRIPRPTIIPRINPGTAFSSGNSYASENMNIPSIEKYLTDRVKYGEMRPTFFAPLEMPEDNSILPDLERKLPQISASAGFNYPSLKNPLNDQSIHLDYKIPQISVSAKEKFTMTPGVTPLDIKLETKQHMSENPGAANSSIHLFNPDLAIGTSSIDGAIQNKISTSADSGNKSFQLFDSELVERMAPVRNTIVNKLSGGPIESHFSPSFKTDNISDIKLPFKIKRKALQSGNNRGIFSQGSIPSFGITTKQNF